MRGISPLDIKLARDEAMACAKAAEADEDFIAALEWIDVVVSWTEIAITATAAKVDSGYVWRGLASDQVRGASARRF